MFEMQSNSLPYPRPAEARCTAGASLYLDAGEVLASELALAQFREQLRDLLDQRAPLTVRMAGLSRSVDPAALFAQSCEALAAAANACCASPDSVGIAIAGRELTPQTAWDIRTQILGPGDLFLLVDHLELYPPTQRDLRQRYEQSWTQLWELRDTGFVRAACAPLVTSQCPLLAAEKAGTVLPGASLQAPVGSAWVRMQVNIPAYMNARGELDEQGLRAALHACIDAGDAIHGQYAWPTARMRQDSWSNRRLAIEVTGIGELAKCRALDPRSFASLTALSEIMQSIQRMLQARSSEIARRHGCAPALGFGDPVQALTNGHDRESWSSRWSAAIERHAVRHRNLMVLSPWSVLPQPNPDPAYLDLLPLLHFADACAFPAPPELAGWNSSNFKDLYRRLWAVLERRNVTERFAEEV